MSNKDVVGDDIVGHYLASQPERYGVKRAGAAKLLFGLIALAGVIGLIVVILNFETWVAQSQQEQSATFRLERIDQLGPYAGIGFSILMIVIGAMVFFRPGVTYTLEDGTPLKLRANGRRALDQHSAELAHAQISTKEVATMRRYISDRSNGPRTIAFLQPKGQDRGEVLITYVDGQGRVQGLPPIEFAGNDFAIFKKAVGWV